MGGQKRAGSSFGRSRLLRGRRRAGSDGSRTFRRGSDTGRSRGNSEPGDAEIGGRPGCQDQDRGRGRPDEAGAPGPPELGGRRGGASFFIGPGGLGRQEETLPLSFEVRLPRFRHRESPAEQLFQLSQPVLGRATGRAAREVRAHQRLFPGSERTVLQGQEKGRKVLAGHGAVPSLVARGPRSDSSFSSAANSLQRTVGTGASTISAMRSWLRPSCTRSTTTDF